jgi:hypothetical protein
MEKQASNRTSDDQSRRKTVKGPVPWFLLVNAHTFVALQVTKTNATSQCRIISRAHKMSDHDESIQNTADSAISSKLSCHRLGYIVDDFASCFVKPTEVAR